jgi:AraC family transcriptional regulator, activator of mtrCDE
MDVLSDILRTIRVQGSLYYRAAFSKRWAITVPHFGNVARYHMVSRGICWVRIDGLAEPLRLESGDLVVIPHGAEHCLTDDLNAEPVPVDDVIRQSGFVGEGPLLWGSEETNEPTSLICGHFSFGSEPGGTLVRSLPAFIHIKHTETLNYGWLADAMKFIAYEANSWQPGSEAVVNRLSEIVFVQTIRAFAQSHKVGVGILSALNDHQIGRALQAMHRSPASDWTVDDLAREAGMSRTLFSDRMKETLGLSPINYLTQWRMELAREGLADRRLSVAEVAEKVGYQSLPAFSRAFKRHFGLGPGELRRR